MVKQNSGNGFYIVTSNIPQMIAGKIVDCFESLVLECDHLGSRSKIIKQADYESEVAATLGHGKLVKEFIHVTH